MTLTSILRSPWLIAGLVGLAATMEILDMTVVNVAIQNISGELSVGPDEVSWIVTSYLVTSAIVMPVSGWLQTVLGRKRYFLICISGFTLASLLCGLAPGLRSLIFFRALQGLMGGGLIPTAQVVLTDAFPPEKRRTAIAIYGFAIIIGPALGPTLGGYITDTLNWRWVFLINVPIGVLLTGLIALVLKDPRYVRLDRLRRLRAGIRIDYLGFALLFVGVGCLQILLDKGQEDDWLQSGFICVMAAISFLSLCSFVIWELGDPDPIVGLHLLRDRNFCFCNILMMLMGFIVMSSALLLPQLIQTQFGYTALRAGLILTPGSVLTVLTIVFVGRTGASVDPRLYLAIGLIGTGGGLYLMSACSPDSSQFDFTAARVMQTIWSPFLFVPANMIAYGSIARERMGAATALLSLSRSIGGSIGLSAVFTYLARMRQIHENYLAADVTPASPGYHGLQTHAAALMPWLHGGAGLDRLTNDIAQQLVLAQSNLLSYLDSFRLLAFLFLLPLPGLLFVRVPKRDTSAAPPAH